jgi:hypothetical protein
MAFKQLHKDVLIQVAEDFAVELPFEKDDDKLTKNVIVKALDDDGITWKMYKEAFPDPEDQEEVVKDDEPQTEAAAEFKAAPQKVLVKMSRPNGTFEIRGYKFTKDHPFLPVDADDADYLVNNQEGFGIATPREVEEYYS